MKLSTSVFLASLLGITNAAGRQAAVYISDNTSSSPNPSNLTPETLRLVLAQRLGLSDFHRLHGADESTLTALNDNGGKQRPLFGGIESVESTGSTHTEVVLVIEGVQDFKGELFQLFQLIKT
jgi:hypothetical protein